MMVHLSQLQCYSIHCTNTFLSMTVFNDLHFRIHCHDNTIQSHTIAIAHHGNNKHKQPGVVVEVISTPLYTEYQSGHYRRNKYHLYQEALQLIPYEEPHCLQESQGSHDHMITEASHDQFWYHMTNGISLRRYST